MMTISNFRRDMVILFALWHCAGGLVFGQAEKGRMWTSEDGKKIYATLLRLEGGRVVLNWKGKETKVAKRTLGEQDQQYLEGFEDRMIFGEVETMEIKPSSEQQVFLSQHG